jgi:hypothetical protein
MLKPTGLWLGAALVFLGLTLYLQPLLCGRLVPYLDAFNPKTLGDLWWLISRKGYGAYQANRSLAEILGHVHWWGNTLWANAGIATVPLALVGAAMVWKKSREWLWIGLGLYAAVFVAVVLVNHDEANTLHVMDYFFLPGAFLFIAAAALGTTRFMARPLPLAALSLIGLLALGLCLSRLPDLNRRDEYTAYDFSRGFLVRAPEKSFLMAQGDFFHFPSLYTQVVEGRRPDLIILQTGLLANPVAMADLARVPERTNPWDPQPVTVGQMMALPMRFSSLETWITQPNVLDVLTWYQFWWIELGNEAKKAGNPALAEKAFKKAKEIPGKLGFVS